jgi:hypothetical protein
MPEKKQPPQNGHSHPHEPPHASQDQDPPLHEIAFQAEQHMAAAVAMVRTMADGCADGSDM